MVTLTVTEATLNATRAALEERVKRLELEIKRHTLTPQEERHGVTLTEDAQRALVWNIAALHETKTAIEDISEDAIEQADPVTAAKAYAELGYHDAQIAYGDAGPVTEPELIAGYGGWPEPEGDSDVYADRDALNREGDPYFNGAFGAVR